VVAPGDVASFVAAVADVLGSEAHAQALGSRARATVQGALTWEQYVRRIDALLGSSIAPASPRRRRTAGYGPPS
jgi:glycosyltransferase involved in cell wall biosynthesis